MRTLIIVCSSLVLLAACAAAPETKTATAAAPAAKAETPAQGPQCYSGDAGKFFNVGEKTSISGVQVACDATSDGKSASWIGVKN